MKVNNLNVGDKIKVRTGIMCPDLEGLSIEGWQGEITEISKDDKNNPLICIEWDDTTLENMPSYFIEQGEEEGLDNNLMYLYIEDVEQVNDDQ